MKGRHNAERDAYDEREEHRHNGQKGCLRECGADDFAHAALALIGTPQKGCLEHHGGGAQPKKSGIGGVLVGGEKEIACAVAVVVHRDRYKVVEIVQVLQRDWLVAAEVAVDDVDTLLVGTLTKHHASRVAGENVEEEEHKSDYSQKHQESVEKPFANIPDH